MNTKRMSTFAFGLMLLFALAADFFGFILALLGVIPYFGIIFLALGSLIGPFFIGFCRLVFWLIGYRSDNTLALTIATALVEFTPGLSLLPGCTAFVVGFYMKNKTASLLSETRVGRLALTAAAAKMQKKKKHAEKEEKKAEEDVGEAIMVA